MSALLLSRANWLHAKDSCLQSSSLNLKSRGNKQTGRKVRGRLVSQFKLWPFFSGHHHNRKGWTDRRGSGQGQSRKISHKVSRNNPEGNRPPDKSTVRAVWYKKKKKKTTQQLTSRKHHKCSCSCVSSFSFRKEDIYCIISTLLILSNIQVQQCIIGSHISAGIWALTFSSSAFEHLLWYFLAVLQLKPDRVGWKLMLDVNTSPIIAIL